MTHERVWTVTVGVCLQRPPKIDEYRRAKVWAPTPEEAELIALQVASCTCAMPVWSEVEDRR